MDGKEILDQIVVAPAGKAIAYDSRFGRRRRRCTDDDARARFGFSGDADSVRREDRRQMLECEWQFASDRTRQVNNGVDASDDESLNLVLERQSFAASRDIHPRSDRSALGDRRHDLSRHTGTKQAIPRPKSILTSHTTAALLISGAR